jgi:hypothetical protein
VHKHQSVTSIDIVWTLAFPRLEELEETLVKGALIVEALSLQRKLAINHVFL